MRLINFHYTNYHKLKFYSIQADFMDPTLQEEGNVLCTVVGPCSHVLWHFDLTVDARQS